VASTRNQIGAIGAPLTGGMVTSVSFMPQLRRKRQGTLKRVAHQAHRCSALGALYSF